MEKDKRKAYLSYKKPHKIEWILVVLAGMILGSFYLYSDIADTSACGIKFWNALFAGRLPVYYYETYVGIKGSILEISMGGSYDFALYFVFALYNFPLWLWEKITGCSFLQFVITKEYIKGIIWIFAGISGYLLYRIAQLCDVEKDEAQWCPFLFITSSVFFYTEVITSGYDILSVAFTLMGIYCFMKKNDKGFVLSFAIAIAMKMFAIWVFIPLVLVKEKRIWRILVYGIESISVIAIPKIYFAFASHHYMIKQAVEETLRSEGEEKAAAVAAELSETAGYATNGIIAQAESIINDALFPEGRFLEYTYLSMNALPLIFVGMFILWIWCYLNKKELRNQQIIYLCAVAMSIFVLTIKMHPYWVIVLMPYLALVMMLHPARMRDNLLLEGIFSIGYVLNKAITYYWTCGLNMIEQLLAPQHKFSYGASEIPSTEYGFYYYMCRFGERIGISVTNIGYLFKAAAVAGLIMFLFYNYPERKQDIQETVIDYQERRKWLFVRFIISCVIGLLPMLGLVIYLS